MARDKFEKVKIVTYERCKSVTRSQEQSETLEAFDATATANSARSELSTFEDVRGLFITRMRNPTLQDGLTPEPNFEKC